MIISHAYNKKKITTPRGFDFGEHIILPSLPRTARLICVDSKITGNSIDALLCISIGVPNKN